MSHPARRQVQPENLVPYPEALDIVLGKCRPLGRETVRCAAALGRYLAVPVKARHHSPRFVQSAMDGFAVRALDLREASGFVPVTLRISGELPAGSAAKLTLKPGETVRVFTGGRLPAGADAVVIVEVVTATETEAVFIEATRPGANVRQVGEEYRRGDVILPAGVRVTPPVVGVLASLGLTEVAVGRVPSVTVITMGDELLGPGEKMSSGKIHDANGPALVAALQALGVSRIWHRQVCDRKVALKQSLAAALKRSDLVITVGGASVGDHDHTADVRNELGIRPLFSKMAVKPGKPNLFGLAPGGVPVFSLPGNPVSALVGFHQLVKPALRSIMGSAEPRETTLPVALSSAVRKKPGRLHWLRGNLKREAERLVVDLSDLQESHMLSSLGRARVLAEIPVEATGAEAGEVVQGYLLDWER